MTQNAWTISIDTGGTFTDSVARAQDGNFMVAKVPSTPDDPGRALVNSIQALVQQGLDPSKRVTHFKENARLFWDSPKITELCAVR